MRLAAELMGSSFDRPDPRRPVSTLRPVGERVKDGTARAGTAPAWRGAAAGAPVGPGRATDAVLAAPAASVGALCHSVTLVGGGALPSSVVRIAAGLTAGVLAVLSALHVAWGFGAAFPLRSRDELADAVVGTVVVPPPIACLAVAGALATGAALAANVAPVPPGVRRSALGVMAGVFGLRGALGFLGKTDLVSPGSNSERFLHLDRRLYAPLCLALSLGTLAASQFPRRTTPGPRRPHLVATRPGTAQWRLRRSCCDCARLALRARRPAASG